MRKVLLGIAFAAAALMALAATGASAKAATSRAAGCANGVSDRIAGRTVCIRPGGKCVAAHNGKYRARSFTCVNGRLRRYTPPAPAPTPAPTPPPPPPVATAMPGHYEGRTSQNEIIKLDVQPGGISASNLDIHTVNESCNPGGGIYGWYRDSYSFPVTFTGSLAIDEPAHWVASDGSWDAQGHFSLRAAFTGSVLTGNFTLTHSFVWHGTGYSCSSSLVSFTAIRQG